MSLIFAALEKLDNAVSVLDASVSNVESAIDELVITDSANVIDVDFVAKRLDKAIDSVEKILANEE